MTTKRGDSGSAGMLGEKCVIIEAPNFNSKSDQKWCQQQKITKNHQKSTKQKNMKNTKIRKTEKVTKCKNVKSVKVRKLKSEKVTKNDQNLTPP